MASMLLIRMPLLVAIVAAAACSPPRQRAFESSREDSGANEATPEKRSAEKAAKSSPPFFERAQPGDSEPTAKKRTPPELRLTNPPSQLSERDKIADQWIAEATKNDPPSHPTWFEIFASLERKHGKGQVPCKLYDSLRVDFWDEFVKPKVLREGYSIVSSREAFMEDTDLPTRLTLTGRVRVGCKE